MFGVTSAPFLAIRALQQLGKNHKDIFPLAFKSIQENFLVDNLLSGASTIEEALQIKQEITTVLSKGQFFLQKWASNHPQVFSAVNPEERDNYSLDLVEDSPIKTIGLYWHPASDTFGVNICTPQFTPTITKRQVLSFTAKIFDPLSWLAPVTITPKIFLQTLWKEQYGWDDPLPHHHFQKWMKYCRELESLKTFRILRCINPLHSSSQQFDLVGFCNASNVAMPACVYLRTKGGEGVTVELIAAKTKVAPVNGETTPRSEMCSAVLLVFSRELGHHRTQTDMH